VDIGDLMQSAPPLTFVILVDSHPYVSLIIGGIIPPLLDMGLARKSEAAVDHHDAPEIIMIIISEGIRTLEDVVEGGLSVGAEDEGGHLADHTHLADIMRHEVAGDKGIMVFPPGEEGEVIIIIIIIIMRKGADQDQELVASVQGRTRTMKRKPARDNHGLVH